jgi:hypothetical protein
METVLCILVILAFLFIGIPLLAFIAILWAEKVLGPIFDFLFDVFDL